MLWLLGYKIQRLADLIRRRVSDRSSQILLSNTSRQLLERVLEEQDGLDLCSAEDKYLLLDHIRRALCESGQVGALQSQFVIFMLTRIHGDVPRAVLPSLETHHGFAILQALRAEASGLDLRLKLVGRLRPNQLADDQVRQVAMVRAQ